MSSLSGKIIRLAYQRPEYRQDLEPVLRKIAAVRKEALRKKQMQKLMDMGKDFGVMSAYQSGSKKQNQKRHGKLVRDLQKMGYRFEPLRGKWEGVSEKSILIPNIDPKDLFELGRKYEQDAVIHKSKEGVLGMYHTKGEPRAEIAVDPKGNPAFDVSTDKDLYSKARGLSFEFGFLWGDEVPWDGKSPLSPKDVNKFVESKFGGSKGKDDEKGKGADSGETKSDASKSDAKTRKQFEDLVKNQKFTNPGTGNKVKYVSLPKKEQTRIFHEWSSAQTR
jgi:hypothetical protein